MLLDLDPYPKGMLKKIIILTANVLCKHYDVPFDMDYIHLVSNVGSF